MNLKDTIAAADEGLAAGVRFGVALADSPLTSGTGRALLRVEHRRPTPGPGGSTSYELVDAPEERWNLITNAGRDFLHQQGYQTSGLGANGLNYIALTNTAITPGAGDTTLSGEISSNGLARAQGTVAHTAGTNTTTVTYTFTCATAPQAAQAAALFTASSLGTMNHELTFTQRSLQIGDQLVVTFTITLG